MLLSTFGLATVPSGGLKLFGTNLPRLVCQPGMTLAHLVGLAGDQFGGEVEDPAVAGVGDLRLQRGAVRARRRPLPELEGEGLGATGRPPADRLDHLGRTRLSVLVTVAIAWPPSIGTVAGLPPTTTVHWLPGLVSVTT